MTGEVLPRLITRRPAQRMTAKEFQDSAYFNNILISTIRFLDSLPAKTPNEKAQFMRGLSRVLPSFPKSVMEKKVLPALLEEMKDRELISLILQNIFKIIELLPSGRRPFTEKIMPRLKEVFLNNPKPPTERDAAKEAGLMVLLEHIQVISVNCSGKEFKDGKIFTKDQMHCANCLRYFAHCSNINRFANACTCRRCFAELECSSSYP